ncbi:hypothetical protein EDB85DRAFT_2288871 [Lactarius pseudohatsudake]|nr:hypothetical protein EDB85DRAFT_2288871 [Lactarius pseudohatsudake]
MVTCLVHGAAVGVLPGGLLSPRNAMNSGSDSDSFDEGNLTARGRKEKGKSGSHANANKKGNQKAKDPRRLTDDLSRFDLGFMGEVQLSAIIADQARLQERALANFVQVGATARAGPVTCPLPTKLLTPEDGAPPPVPNTLPPSFFFSAPELFNIQNFLQAIVIAAVLCALLPTSVPPPGDFMYRLWTLLLASVNEEHGVEDARLVNLADELVRASSLVDDEAGKLRAAVARTVRATDPVFLLLQRRLLSTLAERLARAPTAPTTLNVTSKERTEVEGLDVKGFGDPVLTGAIEEGLKKLRTAVRWVESIWADTLEPGSMTNGIDERRQS